jgi:molybdenum cofactor cytidylyltransferase
VSRIAGIVLAAGMSRRLGRPKQLLQLGDATVIEHVVRGASSTSLDEVVVVLGARADDVRAVLGGLPVCFVENDRFADGQGTSLAAGIASLGDDVDAAVVLLGDQPHVDPAVIDRVVQARRNIGASIVMARYGEERGHPVLFGREHFPALLALEADQGGRDVIRQHIHDVMTVSAESSEIPLDIDTEADWIAMLKSLGS